MYTRFWSRRRQPVSSKNRNKMRPGADGLGGGDGGLALLVVRWNDQLHGEPCGGTDDGFQTTVFLDPVHPADNGQDALLGFPVHAFVFIEVRAGVGTHFLSLKKHDWPYLWQ
jgi:hypothetical protein